MKITTIQVYEDTKRKLSQMKEHQTESYDSVLKRILEDKAIPSKEEMFKRADEIKEQKKYTTKELLRMIHARRGKI
jgi:hypothetical protein